METQFFVKKQGIVLRLLTQQKGVQEVFRYVKSDATKAHWSVYALFAPTRVCAYRRS
jgi:hypothetical protein